MANSATDAGNSEKEIRKKLVESGIVDVIISTPPNMFLNVTLSSTLWFLDKGKKGTDRQNKILFINAQDIFTPIDRAHNEWTHNQIQEIADIVRRYRDEKDEKKYDDIKGRCKTVTLDEVRENDYSLNPGRYVEIVDIGISDIDFEKRMKELTSEFSTLSREALELEKNIMDTWKSIL
jgi:type I restriction enzyme M protein